MKMHMKKPLSIVLTILMLMGIVTAVTATPWDGTPDDNTPAQAIWIDPKNTTGLGMGNTFVVDVLVNITDPDGAATGMWGWQYCLQWNSTVLNAKEIQTHGDNVPSGDLMPGHTSVMVADNTTTANNHTYVVTPMGGTAFTGVNSLCTYTFQVMWQPTEPAPDFCGLLDFIETGPKMVKVTDDAAGLIIQGYPLIGTIVDGMYCVEATEIEKPKIGIDPSYVLGVYGQNFTIDIVIEAAHPLFSAWDLCGWQAKLQYNTTVLDALECINGTFMSGFAGPNGTIPVCQINDTAGTVFMAEAFLGAHTKPSGAGVLMTVKFNATSMYVVPPGIPPHLYPLTLFDVLLVDCSSQPIPLYGVNDGTYEEPYKVLGWALDCWTDPYRKLGTPDNFYYTPYTGEGISSPGENEEWEFESCEEGWNQTGDDVIWEADAYEPQEFVKLYAYLSYNEWPEQNKLIAFEIYGPCNPYHNISIIRTATTNASGVATINFTIPHPCENLEEIVFGKWICWQVAQVKDPWDPLRFKKVVDVLMWDVGWKVELLEVTAGDSYPCGEVPITVYYKNIAQVPMYVTLTFTVFDTLLDPLGELVIFLQVAPGIYCHPAYGNVTVYIHIPKWAHVGPCAHVCVNAFTVLPSLCGLPYCPEVSVHFTITLPP